MRFFNLFCLWLTGECVLIMISWILHFVANDFGSINGLVVIAGTAWACYVLQKSMWKNEFGCNFNR